MAKKKSKDKKADSDRQLVSRNRKALRNYDVTERLEAGMVLKGTEVKSCRAGKANVNDGFVQIREGEAYLIGSYIAEYEQANRFNHDPTRTRKLLLHRREIDRLSVRIGERGMVVVPLALYFRNGIIKVELGVGTGRTHGDKRDRTKERELDREVNRAMRRGRR